MSPAADQVQKDNKALVSLRDPGDEHSDVPEIPWPELILKRLARRMKTK